MEILKYPHPFLRRRCKETMEIDASAVQRVQDMFRIMYQSNGVGLAAPQVGWDARLFVANATGKPEDAMVFINPRIVSKQGTVTQEEGCLSIPGVWGKVIRAEQVHVQAFDLQGESLEIETAGLLATIVQHESDHLDGVLFITKLTQASRIAVKQQLKEMEEEFRTAHPGEKPMPCSL